jgi:hypothetical protein
MPAYHPSAGTEKAGWNCASEALETDMTAVQVDAVGCRGFFQPMTRSPTFFHNQAFTTWAEVTGVPMAA